MTTLLKESLQPSAPLVPERLTACISHCFSSAEEVPEAFFYTPVSRYVSSDEEGDLSISRTIEDEEGGIDDISVDDTLDLLASYMEAMGFYLEDPAEMQELVSSIRQLQASMTQPLTFSRIALSDRIEVLLKKAVHRCQPHNQRNIYCRNSKVHLGSFDPRHGARIKSAIVKHLPMSELYLVVMETFINYFLKHVAETEFVGDVYQVFITPRSAICTATEPIGDHDLARVFSSDLRRTYGYIHDVAVILESLQAECSFIHGDLKADNIRIDNKGYISLIDFGQSCITYNGVSFFEPVSLILPEDFCKKTQRYDYDPIKIYTSKHRFSGDLLYFLLTMMLYHVRDEETGAYTPIPETFLGTKLAKDFFTFQCSNGTVVDVYHHVKLCRLAFREYVFSKDPEILFQWVPIEDPADQDRFLEQFRPSNIVDRVLELLSYMRE